MCQETVQFPLSHMMVTNSRHLLLGNIKGQLTIKELHGLRSVTTLNLQVPITCISVTHNNTHILVGLRDGKLIIVGVKKNNQLL